MESLVQGRISDCLTKAGDCYLKGMYDKCIQTLQLLYEEAKATHSLLEVCSLDKCVFCCLIENNILVSKGLQALKWRLHDAYSAWNDLMQSFSDLHQQVKSLQMVYRIPVKCYLNIVYNALYWGWCHPNGLQCDESHIETYMQIAVSCFKRVLEVSHDACPSSSFCNIQDVVLYLMKRVSNNLLVVSGEESQQLVEICIIVIYMLIELKAKKEIITECMNISIHILNMSSELVSRVFLAAKSKKKDAVSSFKFGLHEVNSAMGKCDIETVLEVLKTACCMCFIRTEQYAKCVTCLDGHEDDDIKFQFIHYYMKAYACYHSNDAEACLLSLLKLESVPLSTQMKVRGHLLHGSLLAKQGRHSEALQEFFKSLSIGLQNTQEKKDFYPVTLYHIAEEYGALHCMCKAHSPSDAETVQNHGKSSSRQTELLQALLLSDHLDTLQHLVQVLKDNDDDEEFAVHTNFTFSIQLKILKNLHPQPEINLPVALFKLATTLAANGHNYLMSVLYTTVLQYYC
ncbi:hypothetical protein B7P43_G09355 [Cryptotermes secundus]|uniref:Uncharacterized protein n=1 Tax=Cryptotermes secundus TaxID=105785 RepID=A0A2J7RNM9_9NEOP|nr:hypothetical protein B7P43_G09355 [Cryptotermes secundus]